MSQGPLDVAARLEQERRETAARVAALSLDLRRLILAAEGSNADDEHDPEGTTLAFERAQVSSLLDRSASHLAEVDRAAERVGAGTYGTCERCGRPIAAARLEARPASLTCLDCAAGPRR